MSAEQSTVRVVPRPAPDLGAHRHLVVSERLRQRRRDLGLTQKEVVARLRRMGVGTTNKALSSLEHGAGLDVAKLPELACALECTLTWLVGLTDSPQRWQPDEQHWPGPPRRVPAVTPPRSATSAAALSTGNSTPIRAARGPEPPPVPPIMAPVEID